MTVKDEDFRVEFELNGFSFAPMDISKETGLQPSLIQEKGSEIRHKKTGEVLRKVEENRWVIRSDLARGSEPEEQFTQLLGALKPHKEYFKKILEDAQSAWLINGYSHKVDGQIGLNIPKEILAEVSYYGSEIDVDIYWREK